MLAQWDPEEIRRRRESGAGRPDEGKFDQLIQDWGFTDTFNRIANAEAPSARGAGGGVPIKTKPLSLNKPTLGSGIPDLGQAATGSKVANGNGFLGWLGRGSNALGLGGIAAQLLGALLGSNGPNPFTGAVAPEKVLGDALNSTNAMGRVLQNHLAKGQSTPSAYVQAGPAPVSVPGLPFQIGGGFGMDPALRDPSLLTRPGIDFGGEEVFGPKRRTPGTRSASDGEPSGQAKRREVK